jgi:hypothetical protein
MYGVPRIGDEVALDASRYDQQWVVERVCWFLRPDGIVHPVVSVKVAHTSNGGAHGRRSRTVQPLVGGPNG